jgi:hypothetical protein
MRLNYEVIEAQIAQWLPELSPAARAYWTVEGAPGQDCGPYIFFGRVVSSYIEVLLAMHASCGRDRLLARAFGLVDAMLEATDQNVRDLAFIEVLEGADAWWLARSLPFLGPRARAKLDQFDRSWRGAGDIEAGPDLERDVIDLCGVRDAVLAALSSERIGITDVPGISAPREWQRVSSIDVARERADATAFLSCFGTSRPYVVAPLCDVSCDERTLEHLAGDLAEIDGTEPEQRSKAEVSFFPIARGERVWQMNDGDAMHTRWTATLWIARQFEVSFLADRIRRVLSGASPRLMENG